MLFLRSMDLVDNIEYNAGTINKSYLQISMHKPFPVNEVDSFCDLQKNAETLRVLSELRLRALSHPVLQVLLPAQLHLDVQVDFGCLGQPWSRSGSLGRKFQRRWPGRREREWA